MKKKISLADSIKASLPTRRRGVRWEERIPPDVLTQLESLRKEWRDGTLDTGCKTLAVVIAQRLNDDKISTIGVNGVLGWLKRKD